MFMKMGTMTKGSKCVKCKKTIDSGIETLKGDICFPCMDKAKKKQSILDIVLSGIKK